MTIYLSGRNIGGGYGAKLGWSEPGSISLGTLAYGKWGVLTPNPPRKKGGLQRVNVKCWRCRSRFIERKHPCNREGSLRHAVAFKQMRTISIHGADASKNLIIAESYGCDGRPTFHESWALPAGVSLWLKTMCSSHVEAEEGFKFLESDYIICGVGGGGGGHSKSPAR